uniref:hypothetical protein n=1 Tax=Thaumasiovibrio occultus TaxID=1891184 RepID=UPI000B35D11C|nr:hypothetical protein [Thaumasiovibrio occultus]
MLSRYFSLLWFALLWAVLPAQANVHTQRDHTTPLIVVDADTSKVAPSTSAPSTSAPTTAVQTTAAQAPAAETASTQQPAAPTQPTSSSTVPYTENHSTPNQVGALLPTRFSAYFRYSESNDAPTPFPLAKQALPHHLATSQRPLSDVAIHYLQHSHSYRLSGWKETNAFYVALNSQF